jgi:hypothetical protein|nr:MAG TPA: hypothetical protein [Caudoviricetes sp.]
MGSKINRIGEENINNFGSKMIIIEYRKYSNIDVYFPEYDYTVKHSTYNHFKNGNIKCPYDKRVFGVGYFGEGKYKIKENGKTTKCYNTWHNMVQRCYDEKEHKRHPTYKDCTVYKEWHNFQNFAKWYEDNYYEVEGERMELDKDILVKHNKIYSPETCIFVPHRINSLFVKSDKSRGKSPVGTNLCKNGKYRVYCSLLNLKTSKGEWKHLGYYETQEKAFEVYKYYKEKNIKDVANYYKNKIPNKLYQGLYLYEVEITD